MIAVTGASGQLGRLVINTLLQHTAADNIIAMVRNPDDVSELAAQGVQIRQADYTQTETLNTAMQGVDKLLLISSSAVGQRIAQHQAVIDAAKDAGIKLLAYTSILRADSSPMSLATEHKATEAHIASSGIPAVILRNGWYSENYTQSIPAILGLGMVAGAAQEGRIASASRQDYADAAASVLLSAEDQAGKIYELAGDSSFTLAEYAAEIAAQTGKNISYQPLDAETFAGALKSAGLPDELADMLAETEMHAANGSLFDDSKTLSSLIARETTPISASIKAALA